MLKVNYEKTTKHKTIAKMGKSNAKNYDIGIDNVSSESVPDATMASENNNTVIVNRDRTKSATVASNND